MFGGKWKKAFQELRERLAYAETLGYFDKDAPTQVIADAGPVGLGAVLTRKQKNGQRVICYASRSLTDTERRYSPTEKEALALVWACQKFHPYVYGVPFDLVTEHKPLEVIYGPRSKPCAHIASELCSIGQLILRGTRIVIPKKLRPRVLYLAHEGLGIVGTKKKLRSKVRWPGMEKDAEKHCKTCYGCQLVSRSSPPEPVRSTALPTGQWRDLAIDLLGPLPIGESILVFVDYYSRYYEIDTMRSKVASKVISSREEIFARHGLPKSLTSDNGPQFIATEFTE